MSYRDDREALRQQNEQLERELAAARRELARVRAEDTEPPEERASRRSRWLLLLLALGVLVLVLGTRLGSPIGAVLFELLVGLVVLIVASRLLVVAPSHAAVFLVRGGRRRGVRGRALRVPLVDRVERVDLSVRSLTVDVTPGAQTLTAHVCVHDPARAVEICAEDTERQQLATARLKDAVEAVAMAERTSPTLRRVADAELAPLGMRATGVWLEGWQ